MPNLLVATATIMTTRTKRRPAFGHDVHIKKMSFGVSLGHNSICSVNKKKTYMGKFKSAPGLPGRSHSPGIVIRHTGDPSTDSALHRQFLPCSLILKDCFVILILDHLDRSHCLTTGFPLETGLLL